MAHNAAVRATSLAASAGMLGVCIILALTVSYSLPVLQATIDGPTVLMEREPTPPPTPEVRDPRPIPPMEDATPYEAIETAPTPLEPFESVTEGIPTGPPALQTITRPDWVRRPHDLQRYYPRRALRMNVEGDVSLDCIVATSGRLQCSVASETPPAWGFGDAALRIAADHQMVPAMRDGAPIQGAYRMRVPFRVE